MPRDTLRLILLTLVASATGAHADEALEARLRDQLKQAVTQVRQLQIENATLKADLAKAAAVPPSVPAAPAADPAATVELQASLDTQSARADALETQVAQLKKTLAQWQQSYEQATTLARERDAAAKKSDALFQGLRAHVDTCEKNNATLVSISRELLDRYKNKGVIEAARNKEPLLGLHRVELERLAREYHAHIVDATAVAFDPDAPLPAPERAEAATPDGEASSAPAATPQPRPRPE